MLVDFKKIDGNKRYKVMSSTIIPRPIAWIVTENSGVINIAPFSYFTPLSSNPATFIVSIGHKEDGSQKDTLRNILEQEKATVCFVKEEHLEEMINSAKPLSFGISEAEAFGIKVEKIVDNFPPIIKDVESAIFCKFMKKVELEGKTVPIILEIDSYYFDDKFCDENLNIKELSNIGRVGKTYARLEKI